MTSKKYGEHLNEMLGIHKRYTLLHDTYHGGYSIEYEGKVIPNTVFCGGRNGRDWELLIRIAQAMPEITFNCIMPKDKLEEYKENFGKNMVVKSDIPEQEFLEFMCQSQLVVTPLDTEAPAGLIAFYQAAANGKMELQETFPGRWAENCTQAIARDLLAHAMVNLEAAGYPIVFHVHDEAVMEAPIGQGGVEEVCRIMAIPPKWARDLPLRADGEEMEFYRK